MDTDTDADPDTDTDTDIGRDTGTDTARYRDLLAVSSLRAVLVAHTVSTAGSVIAQIALSALVFARTGSSLLSAATLALGFLPFLLTGSVLSGVADRQPVRRLLVRCDLASAALVAVMLLPGLPVAALLGLVVALGTLAPVFGAARSADLADTLPAPLWLLARSALRTLSQSALLLGFAAGGLLLTAITPRTLLVLDLVSFLLSALLLRLGTPARPARAPLGAGRRPSLREEATSGLRLLRDAPRLRRLLLLGWLPWGAAAGADGLAVTYSVHAGNGSAGAAALLCGLAGGTVLGELLASQLTLALRKRLVVPLSAGTAVPLLALALSPPVAVAAGLLVLVGLAACSDQGLDALVLAEAPETARGRVLAVQSAGLMLVQGLGILAAGALAEVLEPGPVLAVGGAVALVLVAGTARGLRTGSSGTAAPPHAVGALPGGQ